MGLLGRLFKKDPDQELARAEGLLAGGDALRALEISRRYLQDDAPPRRQRAAEIGERSRRVALEGALERASRAEEEGYPGDAAEWLRGAAELLEGDQVGKLDERIRALEARAAEREDDEGEWGRGEDEGESAAAEGEGWKMGEEEAYETLVHMLEESVAALYEDRPKPFREAYLALNEGDAEGARSVLDALAEKHPQDPVYRLERGRCRLLSDDAQGAREDFEAAWPAFGDAGLNAEGTLSVPSLWAEALLALGEPRPILERLAEAAHPSAGDPNLSYRFALALIAAERLEEARGFLATAAATYPSQPLFAYHLAAILAKQGERRLAIDCLETAIAPSCATGSCARPPRHLPSLRALAGLYLEGGSSLERVHQLVGLAAEEQGGRLGAEDRDLLARYYEAVGDPRAAAEAERAEKLRAEQGEAGPEVVETLGRAQSSGRQRAAL